MSALVHPENQKIIWNIVNNNIYVNEFFQKNTNVSKEQWFRSIIEKFYIQSEGQNLSMEELNILNKDVLTFMVKSVHSIPVQSSPPEPQTQMLDPYAQTQQRVLDPYAQTSQASYPHQQRVPDPYAQSAQTNYSTQIQTPPYVPNNIGEQTNQQFEDKRQEYEQMNAKPVPEQIDFKEKEKDTIIDNMDELINQHLSEREQQLKELTPRMVTQVNPIVSMPTNDISSNITVQIQEISQDNVDDKSDELPLKIQISELTEHMRELKRDHDVLKRELVDKVESHTVTMSRIEKDILYLRENANKIKQLDQQSEKSDE